MAGAVKGIFYLLIIVVLGFYVWTSLPSACESPVQYRLGHIDSRFGIEENTAIDILAETEKIWEEQAGRNLFEYDSAGSLAVNFVFDERQKRFLESERAKEELVGSEELIKRTQSQYSTLISVYNQKLALYEGAAASYEQRLDSFNTKVASWNRRGGAPKGTFEELEQEQQELQNELDRLKQEQEELNNLADQINSFVREGNLLVQEHNQDIETYNDRYGTAREFNQGDYTGDAINIYQFGTIPELRLILAHELGHALSIGHVNNELSIMYYLMGEQNLNNPMLTAEDMAALRTACDLE